MCTRHTCAHINTPVYTDSSYIYSNYTHAHKHTHMHTHMHTQEHTYTCTHTEYMTCMLRNTMTHCIFSNIHRGTHRDAPCSNSLHYQRAVARQQQMRPRPNIRQCEAFAERKDQKKYIHLHAKDRAPRDLLES